MANFQTRWYTLPNGSNVYFSDTIPTGLGTGITASIGDYCVVSSTTANGSDCVWQCITAGSPGTWVVCARGILTMSFGPLSATSTSLAFPITGGKWRVAAVWATATAKGGSGATVTVETLTGTTAPGSGTAQLTAALIIDASYTPNTLLTGTVLTTPTTITGGSDRVGIVLAGTLTALANLFVTISFQKIS